MADNNSIRQLTAQDEGDALMRVFACLTVKQHEVLRYVSENRTSKEIAWEIGISESAVNQRIEGVRSRTGSPLRAELARGYRQYLLEANEACNSLPDKNPQVPHRPVEAPDILQSDRVPDLALSDAVTYTVMAPWQRDDSARIVPEVLDGANAGLNRAAAIVAIAGGIMMVAMVGLGVAKSLASLV